MSNHNHPPKIGALFKTGFCQALTSATTLVLLTKPVRKATFKLGAIVWYRPRARSAFTSGLVVRTPTPTFHRQLLPFTAMVWFKCEAWLNTIAVHLLVWVR